MLTYVACLMYISVVPYYYLHNKTLLVLKYIKYLMLCFGVKKNLCAELRCLKKIMHVELR